MGKKQNRNNRNATNNTSYKPQQFIPSRDDDDDNEPRYTNYFEKLFNVTKKDFEMFFFFHFSSTHFQGCRITK